MATSRHQKYIDHQARDIQLQEQVQADPEQYTHEEIHTFDVIVYIPNPTQHRIWKIVLPKSIIQAVLWISSALQHYLRSTTRQAIMWPIGSGTVGFPNSLNQTSAYMTMEANSLAELFLIYLERRASKAGQQRSRIHRPT